MAGRRLCRTGPRREGEEPKPSMNGDETSDPGIVAEKLPNGAGRPGEEAVERRAGTEGNAVERDTHRAQDRVRVTQALDRVREAARHRKEERFTTLLHHVNPDTLRLAYHALRRTAAAGVDGPKAGSTSMSASSASTASRAFRQADNRTLSRRRPRGSAA